MGEESITVLRIICECGESRINIETLFEDIQEIKMGPVVEGGTEDSFGIIETWMCDKCGHEYTLEFNITAKVVKNSE